MDLIAYFWIISFYSSEILIRNVDGIDIRMFVSHGGAESVQHLFELFWRAFPPWPRPAYLYVCHSSHPHTGARAHKQFGTYHLPWRVCVEPVCVSHNVKILGLSVYKKQSLPIIECDKKRSDRDLWLTIITNNQ